MSAYLDCSPFSQIVNSFSLNYVKGTVGWDNITVFCFRAPVIWSFLATPSMSL